MPKVNVRPKVPSSLAAVIGTDINVLPFKRMAPGIAQHRIEMNGKASVRILRIAAGVALPSHGHGGLEMTQTLTGGYFVGDEAFTVGDIQCVDHEVPHQPIAMSDGPCLRAGGDGCALAVSNLSGAPVPAGIQNLNFIGP